jgi:molybdate transport system substrate-binding protein
MTFMKSAHGAILTTMSLALGGASMPSIGAEPLRVLSAGAFKPVVVELAPEFERGPFGPLVVDNDTAGAILRRLRAGERWDMVIAPPGTLKTLEAEGRVEAGLARPLARVAIGVAVRRGSPKPVIDTVEQFKAAVLAAKNPAFIDPKAGGSSGIYLDGLFQRMGIAEAIRPRAVLVPGGLVAERLVTGEADLAIHQISEILPVAGAELVGPLPDSIQNYTVYSASLTTATGKAAAASALIDLLRSAAGSKVIQSKGMERVD